MKQVTFTLERKMALIAGLSLIIMALVAGVAYGGIFQNLYARGDANVTLTNLNNSGSLFHVFILLFLFVLILDLIVAWALYVYFRHVSESLSLLSALFRLMYCALFGVSFLSLIPVQHQLLDAPQNASIIMTSLGTFLDMWSLALIVISGHLFLLGYLVFKSGYIPRWVGVLLVIASACYFFSNVANLLMQDYQEYKKTVDTVLSLPMALGELGLAGWLIFKGGRAKKP